MKGILKVLKDTMLQPTPPTNITVGKYLDKLRNTFEHRQDYCCRKSRELPRRDGKTAEISNNKIFFNRRVSLSLFPISGTPLKNKYTGPYVLHKVVIH